MGGATRNADALPMGVEQRRQLETRARGKSISARLVERARIHLMLGEGFGPPNSGSAWCSAPFGPSLAGPVLRRSYKKSCSQPRQHEACHCGIDQGFGGFAELFVALVEAPLAANPGERAFHNPSSRQHLESRRQDSGLHSRRQPGTSLPAWFPDDLRPPPDQLLDPGNKGPLISSIREQQRDPWALVLCSLQQQTDTITVLNIRRMDFHLEEEPLRVREDMPLPAFDFLPRIVPARPPFSVVFSVFPAGIHETK